MIDVLRQHVGRPETLTRYNEILASADGRPMDRRSLFQQATTAPYGFEDIRNVELCELAAAVGRAVAESWMPLPATIDQALVDIVRRGPGKARTTPDRMPYMQDLEDRAFSGACAGVGFMALAAIPHLQAPYPELVDALAQRFAGSATYYREKADEIYFQESLPVFPADALARHRDATFTIARATAGDHGIVVTRHERNHRELPAAPFAPGRGLDGTWLPSGRVPGESVRDREALSAGLAVLVSLGLDRMNAPGLLHDSRTLVGFGAVVREALDLLDASDSCIEISGGPLVDWVLSANASFAGESLTGSAVAPLPTLRLDDLTASGPDLGR